MKSTSTLLTGMSKGDSLTANGAATNSTTSNATLDFFSKLGASRNMSDKDITNLFDRSLNTDLESTLKLLFYARNARGGAGERKIFKVCYNYLLNSYKYRKYAIANIPNIPFFGYWKDLIDEKVITDEAIDFIVTNLQTEGNDIGLLCKWLPRKGSVANTIRKRLKLTPKAYRTLLVENSKTVEQDLCAKRFGEINYSHVPSLAYKRYIPTFNKRDYERFQSFIASALKGEVKVHAGVITPPEIAHNIHSRDTFDAQWMNQINYIPDNSVNTLVVADVSGSMGSFTHNYRSEIQPITVSVSLALYIAERTGGLFKNSCISFSAEPKVHYFTHSSPYENLMSVRNSNVNTDLYRVFQLMLETGKSKNIPQSEMPEKVIIISDMQFDRVSLGSFKNKTLNEAINDLFNAYGYRVPEIIYWNVNGTVGNNPVKYNDSGVALVSGYSPSICKFILSGEKIDTPLDVMYKVVNDPAYDRVITNL